MPNRPKIRKITRTIDRNRKKLQEKTLVKQGAAVKNV